VIPWGVAARDEEAIHVAARSSDRRRELARRALTDPGLCMRLWGIEDFTALHEALLHVHGTVES